MKYELKKLSEGKYWDESCNPICHLHCRPDCECGNHCWANFPAKCLMSNKKQFVDKSKIMYDIQAVEKIKSDGEAKTFFLCDLSDIGHKVVPAKYINGVFTQLCLLNYSRTEKHTLLILTKWPELLLKKLDDDYHGQNIWIGTTITGHKHTSRLNDLMKFKGFKKWVSLEPLYDFETLEPYIYDSIDQVVVGHDSNVKKTGELYDGSNLPQVRCAVQSCKNAGVPVFVKQLHINGKLSKNINDWPEDLRVRELAWG